jgi:dipeptidyl aminopeptidase/acylaminoacyl peptidase
VWTETRETFPTENRVGNIMLAPIDFDGTGVGEAQRVAQILRGGVSGWLDENRLLMNGRLSPESNESTTFVYDLTTGERTEIFTAERSRLTTVSRDGSWIAYVIVNDKDPERNGLWVERTDGTGEKKVELFGAAQWRDSTHLIIAPFEMDAPSHAFWEYDVETDATRQLTPPSAPFQVASGDWSVSPDGDKIVFVNAADNNIWLWQLAP